MKPRPVIVWRHAGCRCTVLEVTLSPRGWAVRFPSFRFDDIPAGISAIPGGFTGDPEHKWGRGKTQEVVWQLALDRSTWPPAIPEAGVGDAAIAESSGKSSLIVANRKNPKRLVVAGGCPHRVTGPWTQEFLDDINAVVDRQQSVHRELPE